MSDMTAGESYKKGYDAGAEVERRRQGYELSCALCHNQGVAKERLRIVALLRQLATAYRYGTGVREGLELGADLVDGGAEWPPTTLQAKP